jgi:hypothetical protein
MLNNSFIWGRKQMLREKGCWQLLAKLFVIDK